MNGMYDTSWLRYGSTSNVGNFYTTAATTGGWVPLNTPGTAASSTYTIQAEPAYDAWRAGRIDELIEEIRSGTFGPAEPVRVRKEKVRTADPDPCSEQELSDFITGS